MLHHWHHKMSGFFPFDEKGPPPPTNFFFSPLFVLRPPLHPPASSLVVSTTARVSQLVILSSPRRQATWASADHTSPREKPWLQHGAGGRGAAGRAGWGPGRGDAATARAGEATRTRRGRHRPGGGRGSDRRKGGAAALRTSRLKADPVIILNKTAKGST